MTTLAFHTRSGQRIHGAVVASVPATVGFETMTAERLALLGPEWIKVQAESGQEAWLRWDDVDLIWPR